MVDNHYRIWYNGGINIGELYVNNGQTQKELKTKEY